MGRKPIKYRAYDISDYVVCLSTLKDRFSFSLFEIYSVDEYETKLKTRNLTLALYQFFAAIEKPYICRVQLCIIDKENPLFPIIVAEKNVYQSR